MANVLLDPDGATRAELIDALLLLSAEAGACKWKQSPRYADLHCALNALLDDLVGRG